MIKMNKEINNNLPLNIIDIFNALRNNFSKIYTVDRQTKSITIYRYKNLNMVDEEFPKDVLSFEEEIKKYIDKYVLGEDKEAHVSTSSFYRHYKDKYDVMNDNYKRILNQYMHSSQNHNYEDVFINLFNMSKELHYLKNAFDYTGINSLGDFIYQYSYNTVIWMCKRKNIQFEDKDLLLLDVFCGGASIMYQHYILGKFDLSPQQAGKTLYQMFPDVFKISW